MDRNLTTIGTTAESLLADLEVVFPHRSPEWGEDLNELMWRGGQRSVVDWIKQWLEDGEEQVF